METAKTLSTVFLEASRKLVDLSESDVKKLSNGGYELAFKVVRRKEAATFKSSLSSEKIDKLQKDIQGCVTREAAENLLKEELPTKREVEQFARSLDVSVSKQDKLDQIISKVVEATVGAVLRSKAIQGKKA